MQSINNVEVGSEKIGARTTGKLDEKVVQDSKSSTTYDYIERFLLPDEKEEERSSII